MSVDWWQIVAVAFALAADAFAVSIATSLVIRKVNAGHVFRLAFHFGLFQFIMPVLGWLVGRTVYPWISALDHWAAFALLALIGGKMLWESFRPEHERRRGDPTRGWLLLGLSVATSIDALAVGLSLGFLRVPIWTPSVIIGLVAAGMTALGMVFGVRIGRRFGIWSERLGGLVLVAIGVRIVVSHLLAPA